ncbi:ATP-binding protein [bacterium]|nr:ATP-binding protein [bacterium]
MRNKFAITNNVKRFLIVVDQIMAPTVGNERMALIYGDPGLGKTETALWWVNNNNLDGVFIRTKKLMSGRWLLEEIVTELGESPAWRTKELFDQAVSALAGTNRIVILDEIDYLTHDARVIETIRDIHDITHSPFIFIGMDQADKKLKRYSHLYRRFAQVLRFEALTNEDVISVMEQVCEIPFDDSAIQAILSGNGMTAAMIYRWAETFERIAKSRNLQQISALDLGVKKSRN